MNDGHRPTTRTLQDRVAHILAVWFGCGHVPFAPGTAGTLGAIPLYVAIRPYGLGAVAAAAIAVLLVGIWASDRVERMERIKDPQIVCIDEVAGVLIAWLGAPTGWKGLLSGLILFRVLDQWKPWPAGVADKHWRGGFGIMMDDVFAGAWAALILGFVRLVGWLS